MQPPGPPAPEASSRRPSPASPRAFGAPRTARIPRPARPTASALACRPPPHPCVWTSRCSSGCAPAPGFSTGCAPRAVPLPRPRRHQRPRPRPSPRPRPRPRPRRSLPEPVGVGQTAPGRGGGGAVARAACGPGGRYRGLEEGRGCAGAPGPWARGGFLQRQAEGRHIVASTAGPSFPATLGPARSGPARSGPARGIVKAPGNEKRVPAKGSSAFSGR